jgi:hypothetical protein
MVLNSVLASSGDECAQKEKSRRRGAALHGTPVTGWLGQNSILSRVKTMLMFG